MIFASTSMSRPFKAGEAVDIQHATIGEKKGWIVTRAQRAHPANWILVELRRSSPFDMAAAIRIEAEWLRQPGARPVPNDATPDEIEHARRVMLRWLAVFGGEG